MTNQRAIETLANLLDLLTSDSTERPDMAEVSQAIGIACMALENEPYYTPEAVAEKLAVDATYITPPFDTGLIPPVFLLPGRPGLEQVRKPVFRVHVVTGE